MAVDSFWNDDRVAELKRLWVDENLSGTQIAAAMGLKDRNAVMGKIHRLGITRKIAAATDVGAAPSAAVRKPEPVAAAVSDVGTTISAAEAAAPVQEPPPAQEPPPSPPEAPAAEPEAFEGHPVMQLKERSCRWPIGDPQKSGFRFCCAERLGSFPYCAEHAEISYMPQDRQSRRAPARNKAA